VYRIGLIKQEFGDRIAASIRPPELADWLDSVKNDKTGKPLAPASRNRLKVMPLLYTATARKGTRFK
jgi:hypothetical protein